MRERLTRFLPVRNITGQISRHTPLLATHTLLAQLLQTFLPYHLNRL
jgi:hypothetical protein